MISLAAVTAAASFYAGRAITVTCGNGSSGIAGMTFLGDPAVSLTPLACRRARNGDGDGVLVLLHEVAHTTGVDHTPDYCAPNLWASTRLPGALRRFWHERPIRVRLEVRTAHGWSLATGCPA